MISLYHLFDNVITNAQMFRQIGYFADHAGIIRRYKRERAHWDEHLQRTQKFIVNAMQGKNRKSAVVLGSGWLLDVPLYEMSRYFDTLFLYDICHSAEVKKKIKQLGNVELCVCDISCFARSVYRYVKQYRNRTDRPSIGEIKPQTEFDISGYDFVVSCNILNQLDILLTDYMSQFFDLSREETDAFRSNVQKLHLDMLPLNRSCLIADYREITFTADGRECSRIDSVHHPIIKRRDAQCWTWVFDTKMTYNKDKKTFLDVFAVEI
jgi:hypothetical protein